MAIVKIVNNQYEDVDAVTRLVDYIFQPHKTVDMVGSVAINIENAPNDILLIQQIYLKRPYSLAKHLIVSFGRWDHISIPVAYQIAGPIAEYFSDEFQTVYAVHIDEDKLHLHYVINSISYEDGHAFHWSKKQLNDFRNYVQNLIVQYTI